MLVWETLVEKGYPWSYSVISQKIRVFYPVFFEKENDFYNSRRSCNKNKTHESVVHLTGNIYVFSNTMQLGALPSKMNFRKIGRFAEATILLVLSQATDQIWGLQKYLSIKNILWMLGNPTKKSERTKCTYFPRYSAANIMLSSLLIFKLFCGENHLRKNTPEHAMSSHERNFPKTECFFTRIFSSNATRLEFAYLVHFQTFQQISSNCVNIFLRDIFRNWCPLKTCSHSWKNLLIRLKMH